MYEEGSAVINAGKAFINPVGKFSRDISVAYLRSCQNVQTLLDSTSATGIRGIRYAKEAGVRKTTFLEINPSAYKSLMLNLKANGMPNENAFNTSIQEFCNSPGDNKFDAIDLDPFGSLAPYIFDLMKVSKNGTSLMATATDAAVLCGAQPNACLKIYDAVPMHNELGHEAGIRIMISYIARVASLFNFGISVSVSFSYMHYMRSIIKLVHGSGASYKSVKELGFLYKCDSCGWFGTEKAMFSSIQLCPACGHSLKKSGRMWLGPIADPSALAVMSEEMKNIEGVTAQELKLFGIIGHEPGMPFYYSVPKITKMLKIPSVSPARVVEEIKSAGKGAAETHFEKGCIKTDADISEFKSAILRALASKS